MLAMKGIRNRPREKEGGRRAEARLVAHACRWRRERSAIFARDRYQSVRLLKRLEHTGSTAGAARDAHLGRRRQLRQPRMRRRLRVLPNLCAARVRVPCPCPPKPLSTSASASAPVPASPSASASTASASSWSSAPLFLFLPPFAFFSAAARCCFRLRPRSAVCLRP